MVINAFYKIFSNVRSQIFGLIGAKTVGARALVVHKGQGLFVKHTYQKGWYTIGGMVDKDETTLQAVSRELFEEVGLTPLEKPELFGVYHSNQEKRDDYVAFYIVKKFEMKEAYSPEIADKQWFSLNNLPEEITPATKRRVEEYLGKREKSDKW